MTNNEIKSTLKDVQRFTNSMDESHSKKLLQILLNAQTKKDCAFFLSTNVKKLCRKLLSDLIKSDDVDKQLDRINMKKIYTIMGDYHYYPICALCGQPIKIDSNTPDDKGPSNGLMFTWDHKIPKSLGGTYDLENMQPAHKICNNKRGTQPLSGNSQKYQLDLTIAIEINMCGCDTKSKRYRPANFKLQIPNMIQQNQCRQYGG